jgi:peptidoglycan/LPS O-acetylase OafA/YrhL
MLHQQTLTRSLFVDEAVRRSEEVVQTRATHFRSDIQLLRAWAVPVVVLNHARLPYLPGAFRRHAGASWRIRSDLLKLGRQLFYRGFGGVAWK